MKLRLAGLSSGITMTLAALYTLLILRVGLRIVGVPFPRQAWLLEMGTLWQIGAWLWLLTIFCWMLLIVTLMWSYIPAHRISAMLQNGLTLIAAVLAIAGIIAWMNALPWAVTQDNAVAWMSLVDSFALGFLGAAFFMGGLVTAWQAFDLARSGFLRPAWVVLPILSGLVVALSPWLLPDGRHLLVGALLWAGWCAFLALRRLPPAFAEWQ
jgi:hypothetical protein